MAEKLKVKNEKLFEKIIGLENLFLSWREFSRGKMKKADVQEFKFRLEDNIFKLHHDLKNKIYQHSNYTAFNVCDPKLRRIHKASVRDRVLHHAVFRILYPIFDKSFIFDSYSCRIGKGTHRAVKRLKKFCRKLSHNNTRKSFALKCDIKKFFGSVDQEILIAIVKNKIEDTDTIWLIGKIIKSFERGLPLGNVTSQLFANIYLNELDQFIKHNLKIRDYIRYCDDFIILFENKDYLSDLILPINNFLENSLKLEIHPNKIFIRKFSRGIDFLGYAILPHHIVLRTKTKRRILRKMRRRCPNLKNDLISEKSFIQSLQSYLGILKHCRGHKIERKIVSMSRNPCQKGEMMIS